MAWAVQSRARALAVALAVLQDKMRRTITPVIKDGLLLAVAFKSTITNLLSLLGAIMSMAPALMQGGLMVKNQVPQQTMPAILTTLPWAFSLMTWAQYQAYYQVLGSRFFLVACLCLSYGPILYYFFAKQYNVIQPMCDQQSVTFTFRIWYYALFLAILFPYILVAAYFGVIDEGTELGYIKHRAITKLFSPELRDVVNVISNSICMYAYTLQAGIDWFVDELVGHHLAAHAPLCLAASQSPEEATVLQKMLDTSLDQEQIDEGTYVCGGLSDPFPTRPSADGTWSDKVKVYTSCLAYKDFATLDQMAGHAARRRSPARSPSAAAKEAKARVLPRLASVLRGLFRVLTVIRLQSQIDEHSAKLVDCERFDRDPDGTLLIAVAQRPTSLEARSKCLVSFLSEVGSDEKEYKIEAKGDLPCKRFADHFASLVAPAGREVLRPPRGLKIGRDWKEFYADAPGSDAQTRVHIGPDKSLRQIKTEITLRRCRASISVLKVEVTAGDAPAVLYWDAAKLEKQGLSTAAALRVAAWNCRALLQCAGAKASMTVQYLSKLGLSKSIVSLQEIHRGALQLDEFARSFAPRTIVVSSFCGSAQVPVIVNGDFIIDDDGALDLHAPAPAARRGGCRRRASAPAWRSVFADVLEIEGGEPARFEVASGRARVLGRIFASLRGWQVRQLQISFAAVGSAAAVFFSDLAHDLEGSGRGLVRACADDVGGAARSVRDLAPVRRVMNVAALLANLCLKVPKCLLAPLPGPFSVELAAEVADQLRKWIPPWAEFGVVAELQYLGLWMGPAVTIDRQWRDPVAELRVRAQVIGHGVAPPSISAILYCTPAVPIFSHVAQFCDMPPSVRKQELAALAQTFRVALGTSPLSCWLLLQSWGGPRVTRWAFLGCASLGRAALVASQVHADILRRLRGSVSTDDAWRTLEMLASSRPYTGFWRSEASVEMLERAAAGGSPSASSPSWSAAWPAVAVAAREGLLNPTIAALRYLAAACNACHDASLVSAPLILIVVIFLDGFCAPAANSAGLLAVDPDGFRAAPLAEPKFWDHARSVPAIDDPDRDRHWR
ncbi:unnamed protein product [Prorocentrum cordatum]|uniref:Uncharacterized protein n=1 Tax=Prorocentrum cordatum TaxID=2364126 RepID=A0ABN9Y1F8_9DINO|nr:unnamed protein product [Polarella glacialis]